MAIESWLALGAGFLLAAGIAIQGLVMVRLLVYPALGIGGIRVAAAVLLAVAWSLAARSWGQWIPYDPKQATLGLAFGTLAVLLALEAWLRVVGAGWVTDILVLALSIVAITVKSGAGQLVLVNQATAFYLQWCLLLVGTGAVTVAGGTGLVLALRAAISERSPNLRLPQPAGLYTLLRQGAALAWLALGSGVLLATWRAWRATWSLAGSAMHEGWMAAVWLIVGAGLLSWGLGKRAWQWAACLALLATTLAIIGMLAVPGLLRI